MGDDSNLDFHKNFFAMTCHAFGVVSIDTPYVQYKDTEGLRREVEGLKRIGMKAKFAIHPTQINVINSILRPTPEEIKYNRDMITAFEANMAQTGKGAMLWDNKMIDIAAYRRAKALLKRVV
jgi:citrate lyase subunit beta/citryl-CoA lyase